MNGICARLEGRTTIPLREFADLAGITTTTARERLRRGSLGVRVIQARPSQDGVRGSAVHVPVAEVRRYLTDCLGVDVA